MKKTVLITGASRGIGRECAIAFSKNGYNVVANYLNSETEAHTLAKENENIFPVKADVSDSSQVKAMIDSAVGKFGCIDVLINNGINRSVCDKCLDSSVDLLKKLCVYFRLSFFIDVAFIKGNNNGDSHLKKLGGKEKAS